MPNIEAQPEWANVREIGIELARGGPDGNMNEQAKALVARTELLKEEKANKTDIVQGQYRFATLALFNEKKATIPVNSTVIIDEAGENQGANTWDGTTLNKSNYDPVEQANQFTEEKIAEYNLDNIKQLAQQTEYQEVDSDEYELLGDLKDTTIDSKRNILSAIIDNKKYYFLPLLASEINVESLKVKGQEIDISNILTIDEKKIITNIDDTYSISEDDEYALNTQAAYVLFDEALNVLFDTHTYNEALKNLLTSIQKELLKQIDDSYSIVGSSDEYALNNKAKCVVLDQNFNILFDVQTYNDALKVLKQQSETLSDHTTRLVSVENKVAALAINPYIPFIVSNNIFVQNINDFSEKKVTSVGVNHSPVQLQQDSIIWQSSKDTDTDGLYYAQAPNFVEYPLNPRKKIAIWGHSFTDNGILGKRLEELTGLKTYVFGKAGTTSVAIAAMQGGDQLSFTIENNTIPASGSVNISPYVNRLLVYSYSTLKCNFAGVDGVLSRNSDGTQLIFTRDTAGDALIVTGSQKLKVYPYTSNSTPSVPSNTRFDQNDECINVFWLGRNNIGSLSTIISNCKNMINYLKTKSKKVVILADFPTSSETSGSSGANQVANLNAAFKSNYPQFYCEVGGIDILQNFKNHATTEQDATDVANGVTPTSLRSDNLHPNAAGIEINAQFIYQFLQKKGWI